MPAPVPASLSKRALFGGAISAYVPARFDDVSQIRTLPDNQEVFSDPATDQSVMIDLLEQVDSVDPAAASTYHFNTLMSDNASLESEVGETRMLTGIDIPAGVRDGNPIVSMTYGKMRVAKFKDGAQLANLVDVYIACFRLRRVHTDVLVIFNDPVHIAPGSSSAQVGARVQEQSERSALFNEIVSSVTINDYGLFASR